MATALRFDPCSPDDIDVLEFDFSANLPAGITLSGTPIFSAFPSLTLSNATVNGNVALVWFAGAQAKSDYRVSCLYQTSDGRTRRRSGMMFCDDR